MWLRSIGTVGAISLLLAYVAVAGLPGPLHAGILSLYFFDVGHGDAILIQTPDGRNILVDGGERKYQVYNYLRALGIRSLDLIVATHPDSDHVGGLPEVLRNIPTERVVVNGDSASTLTYSLFSRNVILYASAQTAEVVNRSSPPLTVGDLSLTVLNPPIWHFGHVNDDSIVLSFTYGQVSFLLMGDAEATAENDLDESNSLSLNAFVLKVGHHGSSSPSSSSTAGFLRDVQPHVAVVSDDGTHADQCVLSTLAEYAVVYETWRDGTVTLWTDGIGYCVSTSLGTATACSGECADCGPRGSL